MEDGIHMTTPDEASIVLNFQGTRVPYDEACENAHDIFNVERHKSGGLATVEFHEASGSCQPREWADTI